MPNDQDRQSLFDLLREIASAITRGYTYSQAAEKAARETRAAVERRMAGGGVGSVLDGLRPGNAKDITAMLGGAVRSLPEIKALPELASLSHMAMSGAMPRVHNPKSTRSLTKRGSWATVSQSATSFYGSLPPVLSGYGLSETAPGDFGVTSAVAGAGVPNAKMSVWEKRAMGILPPRQRSQESLSNIRMKMLEYATANVVKGFGVLSKTLVGGLGVVSSLTGFGAALHAFSGRIVENNRDLQVYSARLAMTYARIDFNQRIRDLKLAKATEPSAVAAAEQWDKSREALQPLRTFWTKMLNNLSHAAGMGVETIATLLTNPMGIGNVGNKFGKLPTSDKIGVAAGGLAELGVGAWATWKGAQLTRWLLPKMPGGWLPSGMLRGMKAGAGWLANPLVLAGAGAVTGTIGATVSGFYAARDAYRYGLGRGGPKGGWSDTVGGSSWNPFNPMGHFGGLYDLAGKHPVLAGSLFGTTGSAMAEIGRATERDRRDLEESKARIERLAKALDENTKALNKKTGKDEENAPEVPDKPKSKELSDEELQSLWQGHLLDILNYGKNPHMAPANKRVGEK